MRKSDLMDTTMQERHTVDLEQEKFCAGRCCFNMLDVYEMLLPIPKRGGKFFRKLEKMFTGRLARK